jgi:hypothetical protein
MAQKILKTGVPGKLELSIGVDDEKLSLAVTGFARRLTDFRRFWREFWGPQFFTDIQKNFRSQGGAVGGWRALSPAYAAWKRKQVGNKPILQFTGRMMASFNPGDRDNIFQVTQAYVRAGSRLPRTYAHDTGTRVPRRQIIFLGPRRIYEPLLDQFVAEEMAAAGMPNVKVGGRRIA